MYYANEKQKAQVLRHLNDQLIPKVKNIYRVIPGKQQKRTNVVRHMGRTVPLRRIQLFKLQGATRRRHQAGEQPTGEHQRGRRQHLDEGIQRHYIAIQQAHY